MPRKKPIKISSVISVRVPSRLLVRFDDLAWRSHRQRADYLRLVMEEVVKRGGLAIEGVK